MDYKAIKSKITRNYQTKRKQLINEYIKLSINDSTNSFYEKKLYNLRKEYKKVIKALHKAYESDK
jgi:hypothetical protein